MSDQVAEKKRRRSRGSGSVYQPGGGPIWWIAYRGADGKRQKESSGSVRKGDAVKLLEKRNGSRIHNLPIVKNAEKLTFADAAQALTDHTTINHPDSLKGLKIKTDKHLAPFFGNRRMAGITAADVVAYVTHRQAEGIVAVKGENKDKRVADVSNAQVNRELAVLKRMFSLAIEQDLLPTRPTIKMLKESAPRSGFFEREQLDAVLSHLPVEIQPIIEFAYLTGWRIASEVLPLEWRNVDFAGNEIRLDAGTTKNGDGRVFPMTTELRRLLEKREVEHERVKKAGHIVPWVFFREVADGRGGDKKPYAIVTFGKAWKAACINAGCPGRIPHDLRRTAVRNFVRQGIPERVAMRLTGHKTASVFARYDIVSDGDLRDAAARLNVASGVPTGTND